MNKSIVLAAALAALLTTTPAAADPADICAEAANVSRATIKARLNGVPEYRVMAAFRDHPGSVDLVSSIYRVPPRKLAALSPNQWADYVFRECRKW